MMFLYNCVRPVAVSVAKLVSFTHSLNSLSGLIVVIDFTQYKSQWLDLSQVHKKPKQGFRSIRSDHEFAITHLAVHLRHWYVLRSWKTDLVWRMDGVTYFSLVTTPKVVLLRLWADLGITTKFLTTEHSHWNSRSVHIVITWDRSLY